MENFIISRYWQMIEPLEIEVKLELIARLTESIKHGFKKSDEEKPKLLDELFGAWGDMDEELINDLYKSRSISDKEISFDS